MRTTAVRVEILWSNQQYLKENAQTKVTREAKAKFRKPFDRFDAGHSKLNNVTKY